MPRAPYVVVAVVDGTWHYYHDVAEIGGSLWSLDHPMLFGTKAQATAVARRYAGAKVAVRTKTGFLL
jgi:hypothetical protein